MSIKKSLKKVFRPKKYKQDKLAKIAQDKLAQDKLAQDKLAKNIAEEIQKLCTEFSKEFESNTCGFPDKEEDVENFVKYTIKKCCQKSVNELMKESNNVIKELESKSFQDLEWKHKNFLLKGVVGKNHKMLLDDASDEYRSEFEFTPFHNVDGVSIIHVVQNPVHLPMFFENVKNAIETNNKEILDEAMGEYKNAINETTRKTLESYNKVNMDILNQVIDVTKKLIKEFSKSDIWDTYYLILEEQMKLKNVAKEEAKKYSSSKVRKNIENYRTNLNNIREYIKEGGAFSNQFKDDEDATNTLGSIRKYLDGKYKEISEKSDPKKISDVKKFIELAGEIYNGLVIEPECDEKIRGWYIEMWNNLVDIEELYKKRKS